jgi:hypothetical protein
MPLDVLRERRRICDELDSELSYYRRLLHGRLDLLDFERRRRTGEETRSIIEALPEILADEDEDDRAAALKTLPIEAPDVHGAHRPIDRVLGDDFLARLPAIADDELDEIEEMLTATEQEVSTQRRTVYEVLEQLLEELTRRYRDGLASVDGLLQQG